MFCENCGHSLEVNSSFCPECGFRQQQKEQMPQQPQQVYYQKGTKKRSGCLTAFLTAVGLILTAALAAYFLLPGLARPYDLGVKSSKASYESAVGKLGFVKDEAPVAAAASDYKIAYGDPQDIRTELSSEEITSFFNENRPDYYSFKNVQVRINEDNSVDTAGTIDSSYLFDEILKGKYTREDVGQALPMLGLLPDKVNIRCNIDGSVSNNRTESFTINSVSVMGIPIPGALIGSEKTDAFVKNTLDGYLGGLVSKSGSSYDLIQVSNGQLLFEGKLPSSIKHIPAE